MTMPERETGRCIIPSKGYTVAIERTPEVIRDELDDVTLTLLGLDHGTVQWDQVYPDLTNGDRQEKAIELTWERMRALTRELAEAEGGGQEG